MTLVEAVVLEALEHARPDAVEQELDDGEVGAVEVGGHLVEVALRRAPDLRLRLLRSRAPPRARARARSSPCSTLLPHLPLRQQRRSPDHALLPVAGRTAARAPDGARCAPRPRCGSSSRTRRSAHFLAHAEVVSSRVPQQGEQPLHLAGRLLNTVDERGQARLAAAKPRPRITASGTRKTCLVSPSGVHDLAQVIDPVRRGCAPRARLPKQPHARARGCA